MTDVDAAITAVQFGLAAGTFLTAALSYLFWPDNPEKDVTKRLQAAWWRGVCACLMWVSGLNLFAYALQALAS